MSHNAPTPPRAGFMPPKPREVTIPGNGGRVIQSSRNTAVIPALTAPVAVVAPVATEAPATTGLPAGYGPEAWAICENGIPGTRNFLTDNPD